MKIELCVVALLSFSLTLLGVLHSKDGTVLALLLSAGVLVYAVLLLRDFRLCLWRIRNLYTGTSLRLGFAGLPVTAVGQALMNLIEAWRYRSQSLGQLLKTKIPLTPSAANNELAMATTSTLGQSESQESFYERLLSFARSSLAVPAAALVIAPDSAKSSILKGNRMVISQGVAGRRFQSRLFQFVEPYFLTHDAGVLGLSDGLMSDSVFGEFSVFGFRHTLVLPVTVSESESPRTLALLWLGYAHGFRPADKEIAAARLVATKLAMHLDSQQAVKALSEKVHEVESESNEKSQFMTHISHDLRSPLNNIKSVLSLMKLESQSGSNSELADVALRNCESLSELVEDVLDFSLHREGKLEPKPTRFDLSELAEEVVDGFVVNARMKNLNLQFTGSRNPALINADARHVRRALMNLLGNAIKYTREGDVSVVIEEGVQDSWVLRVSDTGQGLSPAQIQKLFTPFSRFDESGSEGIGLGLALSKMLIELNNGSIGASSQSGKGAEFQLEFKCAKDQTNPAELLLAAQPSIKKASAHLEASETVLIVDDNVECAESLARIVRSGGYKVLCVSSVRDAISICNFERPAVVITDGQMPEGGGKRLIKYLAESGWAPRIMVLSGIVSERNELRALGAASVLSKPADPELVLTWIKQSFVILRNESSSIRAVGT